MSSLFTTWFLALGLFSANFYQLSYLNFFLEDGNGAHHEEGDAGAVGVAALQGAAQERRGYKEGNATGAGGVQAGPTR